MWKITEWSKHYENAASREVEQARWIPIKNKQDGDGYLHLLDHEHGPAHYGAFVAIVLLASKCSPRGSLVQSNGVPHTAETIARKVHMAASLIQDTLARCSSTAIGWVEWVNDGAAANDLFDSNQGPVSARLAPDQKLINGDSDVKTNGEPPVGSPSAVGCQPVGSQVRSLPRRREVEIEKKNKREEGDAPAALSDSSRGEVGEGKTDTGDSMQPKAVMVFPCKDGRWQLQQSHLDRWAKMFPHIDLAAVMEKALSWCQSNQRQVKSRDAMHHWLENTWLAREQVSGIAVNRPSATSKRALELAHSLNADAGRKSA